MKIQKLSSIPPLPKEVFKDNMQSNWVDFSAVKNAVGMEAVLRHYGLDKLKRSGSELRGRCPIHKGEGEDSFHVNTEKNCFQCFSGSCKKRGNVLDFVAAMERCSVRDAALKLSEWFSVGSSGKEVASLKSATGSPLATNKKVPAQGEPESGGMVALSNAPLTFELKNVNPEHPYLVERGITKEVALKFGIGFFSGKGLMSGRVVIPIQNELGELVAYAGRAVDDSEPKYKLPPGFQKSLELFNLPLAGVVAGMSTTVVLVEGFFDCIKVHEAGFPCCALMGSSLSEEQERLIRKYFSGAVLLFDGDESGRAVTDQCLVRLGRRLWVRAVDLPNGQQPDQLSAEDLTRLLEAGA